MQSQVATPLHAAGIAAHVNNDGSEQPIDSGTITRGSGQRPASGRNSAPPRVCCRTQTEPAWHGGLHPGMRSLDGQGVSGVRHKAPGAPQYAPDVHEQMWPWHSAAPLSPALPSVSGPLSRPPGDASGDEPPRAPPPPVPAPPVLAPPLPRPPAPALLPALAPLPLAPVPAPLEPRLASGNVAC